MDFLIHKRAWSERGKGVEELFRAPVKKEALFVFFCFLLLLSAGCENGLSKISDGKENGPKDDKMTDEVGLQKFILPISLQVPGDFRAVGWIDDETILLAAEKSNESELYLYSLRNGESTFLYKSGYPSLFVMISPSKNYILIHSSISPDEAKLVILDSSGKEIWATEVLSKELAFEWNAFDENMLLVSAFSEDWSYETYLLDISRKTLEKIELPNPFAKWFDQQHFLFLNWDESEDTMLNDLYLYDGQRKKEEILLPSIVHADVFYQRLLAISLHERSVPEASYRFYNERMEEMSSFSVPYLLMDGDFLVPYYDYNRKHDLFFTFEPLSHGEADFPNGAFQLAKYDAAKGKKEILMENMDNEPISCSPNGEYCLYGFYFEKMIDVKNKEIQMIFEEK